jgi:dipeptidyl aminopeptidase/acylaminoacyl peptidase
MRTCRLLPRAAVFLAGTALASALGAAEPVKDAAAAFGTMEAASNVALSADGKRIVYVGPGTGSSTIAAVVELSPIGVKQIARGDGNPMRINDCDWTAANRMVCRMYGIAPVQAQLLPFTRLLAMDGDGGNQVMLGQRNSFSQLGVRQFDGTIIDLLNGVDGNVLMVRSSMAEVSTGSLAARTDQGVGVDLVDTRTGKATPVEKPARNIEDYISDGLGNVRLMTTSSANDEGTLRDVFTHFYRAAGDRNWQKLGTYSDNDKENSIWPLAVDPIIDAAYVLKNLDGRDALYRISLDGSMKTELVFASKEVDVSGVVNVGRSGRVIGASYSTDKQHVEFFDPAFKTIATQISRALPKLPLIDFVSASADEQTLLVFASSDVDAGHFYVFDRAKKTLLEAINQRPDLKGRPLTPRQPITYPAADGTKIPGYLTLPPGVTDPKGLPAIVMPHGGPSARDDWGFDWLSQFYAQRGFVVLQPNYRGSTGYGDAWYQENGFKSWKVSIGDICDAGRWMVAQGMADPAKLAIVGWSYGGYAALQSNVLDPDLFKAVVAVAPVSDLALLKVQHAAFTNSALVNDFIGSGAHIEEGSPAQNASKFKAPVLMFHGDIDLNVDIAQARKMDKALRGAKKSSQLVVYPKLEHSLRDGQVRADMLRKSDAFLRTALKLPAPSTP